MKYLLILLFLVGCGKQSATYKDTKVEISDAMFSDEMSVYKNGKMRKLLIYDHKEKQLDAKLINTRMESGQYSCTYSGFCFHMGKFQHSNFCSGRRFEEREYTTREVLPTLKLSRSGKIIAKFTYPIYNKETHKKLKRGTCR